MVFFCVPRVALNEADIESFREKAVQAATRLFAGRGYEAVTMRAIAADVGCSPMTPYRYFANKDEILAMVRAEGFRRFGDRQEQAAATTDDPEERLRALGQAYIAFALEEPDTYRVMLELRRGASDPYPELVEAEERAVSFLLQAVEAAIDAKLLTGDPLTVAHHLWAHIHGVVSLHLAGMLHLGRRIDDLIESPASTLPIFLEPD